MHEIKRSENTAENYRLLQATIKSHLADEKDLIANLANISAFIYHGLEGLNWAGFYLIKGGMLVLGPFVGKPACVRIPLDRGVCGKAAREGQVILVEDVHAFEDHIACDVDSNSEIVLPIFKDDKVFGVLDIDSPVLGRFTEEDKLYLTSIAKDISDFLDNLK